MVQTLRVFGLSRRSALRTGEKGMSGERPQKNLAVPVL